MGAILVELLNPYPILILVLGMGLANLWRTRRETLRRLAFVTVPFVALVLISSQPIEYIVLGSLEWKNKPLAARPENAKAIVVLAAGVRAANPGRPSAELDERSTYRCLQTSALYHQGNPCPVVVSGGKSDPSQPDPPCARAMHDFLLALGVRESDLIVEDASRTTYENAVECQKLLQVRGIDEIVLVTDAVHMVRAAGCFRERGLRVVPSACNHGATDYTFGFEDLIPNPDSVRSCQRVWHEWLGITWYWLRGRI